MFPFIEWLIDELSPWEVVLAVLKTVRKVPEHQEATQEGKDRRKNAGPGNRDVKALFV